MRKILPGVDLAVILDRQSSQRTQTTKLTHFNYNAPIKER